MSRSRDHPEWNALAQNFYIYRGNAIRSLTKEFTGEDKCATDVVIAGALTLLLIDVSPSSVKVWKSCIELYHL